MTSHYRKQLRVYGIGIVIMLTGSFFCRYAGAAQTVATGKISSSGITLKTFSRLVQLNVSVTRDRDQQPINGLSKQDFAVSDNGQSRVITSFIHGADRPSLRLIFLIESSGAQVNAVNGLVNSLPKALRSLPRTDKVGIATVFPGYKIVLEPTEDRAAIPKALGQVDEDQQIYIHAGKAAPKFNFNDLTSALSEISKKETDTSGQSQLVVVLVTDDFDLLDSKLSANTSHQLLRDGTLVSAFIDVQNPGIVIAKKIVHGMHTLTPPGMGSRDHGASYFAEQTGGPIIQVQHGNYLEALQGLLQQLSSSYLIGFTPASNELDGKFHKIHVTLKRADLKKAKVSCRRGFWAIP